jgi:hypothetical protein
MLNKKIKLPDMKKYFLLSILFMSVACIGLHAQEFKNTESVASQLKANRVPALQYTSAAKATAEKNSAKTNPAQQVELSSSKAAEKIEVVAKQAVPVITGQGDVTFEQAGEQSKKNAAAPVKIPTVPTQEEKPKEEKKQQ